jgi:uncharacterized protein (TIGR03790 family)
MSTVLTQSNAAAYPDRSGLNGLGLHASMSTGDQGGYIYHDLGAPQAELNVRFVFNPWGLSGCRIVVLAGLDSQGKEALRVSYLVVSGVLSVWTPGGVQLSTELDGVIDWQCVEVAVDAVSGQASLWVNGVLVDQSVGDLSASTIQTILFGAIHKQTDVSGDLYLDELCIADAYVGPVIVEPDSSYASDPARWLVVYNTSDPDAVSWADAYRQARGIPFANLAGLALPTTETISASQYEDMVGEISAYLVDNGLDGQVVGILLGYRVPGYVDFTGNGPLESVPALMQTSDLSAGTAANPNASPASDARLTFDDLAGARMTARLDAPNLAAANELVSRADTIFASGLGGDDSAIYFDPFVGSEPAYQQAFTELLDWATGPYGMKTRLPIKLSGAPSGNQEASFTDISGDGLFLGWSSTLPNPDIFSNPAGPRAVCVQLYLGGGSAMTLRGATPGNWAGVPVDAGYASAVVSCRDHSVSAIPDVGALFDALREGWTLGEAWHVAQPLLRSGFYLVGDPLMTVAMPRGGCDVFGPLQDLEDMDPTAPDYMLAEGKTELDLSANPPALGVVRHYVIRRTDEEGRAEVSSTSVEVINWGGVAQEPVSMPVWPDAGDWPVALEEGQVRLMACWVERIRSTDIETVALLSQADGQAVAVAALPEWGPSDSYVLATVPMPDVKTRYRWRFTSPGGVVQYTPFSAWVEPVPVPTLSLQQIGA